MIVQESDLLLDALDRRLQVDRVLALDPLKAGSGSVDEGTSTTTSHATAAPSAETTVAARLPLGRIVSATVVEIPDAEHVIAEVGQWRVSLAWPSGGGPALLPGQQLNLRVLAHQPMLLFQSVDASGEAIESDESSSDVPTRWSQNALQLARQSVQGTTSGGSGIARFTEPVLQVRIVPRETTPLAEHIAIDDVIVGQPETASTASTPRATTDSMNPALSLPVVLQGPAWPGQPMELVVRRERGDEALDNPALDPWCGDLTIDLPTLGRVSGRLAFSMHGLRIRLEGDDAATVAAMHESSALLAAAFADADLRVQSLSIGKAGSIDGPSADGSARPVFNDRD